MPTFVLIHGAVHGAWCWSPLVPFLEAPALALDLPGRGKRPANLEQVTCQTFADSAVADIERAGLTDVILVGHSMAGVTLPRIADRIPERLARLVFVACAVPRHGESVIDLLDLGSGPVVPESVEDLSRPMDVKSAREMFCNDMDESQTNFVLSQIGPEAPRILGEPTDLGGLRHAIPRTYVRLLQDGAVPLDTQDRCIAALDGADVVDLDTGHDVMVSNPQALAKVLNAFLAGSATT